MTQIGTESVVAHGIQTPEATEQGSHRKRDDDAMQLASFGYWYT